MKVGHGWLINQLHVIGMHLTMQLIININSLVHVHTCPILVVLPHVSTPFGVKL